MSSLMEVVTLQVAKKFRARLKYCQVIIQIIASWQYLTLVLNFFGKRIPYYVCSDLSSAESTHVVMRRSTKVVLQFSQQCCAETVLAGRGVTYNLQHTTSCRQFWLAFGIWNSSMRTLVQKERDSFERSSLMEALYRLTRMSIKIFFNILKF